MADAIDRWIELIGEMGELGRALSDAIDQDDVVAAISAMMQLRRTRSALLRVDAPDTAGDQDGARLATLSEYLTAARHAEATIRAWRARPLPGDAALLETALGTAVLADAILPEVWDFEIDALVLVGPELEPVATVLADLGQRRLVLFGGRTPCGRTSSVASTDELAQAVRTMVPNPPRQVNVRGTIDIAKEELERIAEVAQTVVVDQRIHGNTVTRFARNWLQQALENLPALASSPSIEAVGDRLRGVPMVVVVPGPSLDKNLAQLRALEGRAILVALNRSLKPVLEAGITPDLVLTVDPQDLRYHFEGCDTSQTVLAHAATCHPALFELPTRGYLSLSANGAVDRWIFLATGEYPSLPSGGSVSTTALSLGLRWGCDPIIYLGLDLSFPGGQYYASTSFDGAARAEVDERGLLKLSGMSPGAHKVRPANAPPPSNERIVELPGWNGETVQSSFSLSMFHRWFVESLASGAVTSTVFNCTEGGAFIAGMEHAPLSEVLATLERRHDVRGILDAVIAGYDSEARRRLFKASYSHHLVSMRRCRRLAEHARLLISSGDPGPRLQRIERALVAGLRPLEFLSVIAQREVEAAGDAALREGSEQAYLDAFDALYAALISVIDEVEPLMRRAVERLDPGYGATA